MKEFKFDIQNYDSYLKIEVYSDIPLMVRAIQDYAKAHHGLSDDSEQLEAAFFGIGRKYLKETLNENTGILEREIGKIFLCKKFLTYTSIAHECFHASFHFFKEVVGHIGDFHSPYSDQDEEFLNCIFTEMFNSAIATLTKNKFKIKDEILEFILKEKKDNKKDIKKG